MKFSCYVFYLCIFYSASSEIARATGNGTDTQEDEAIYNRYLQVDKQLKNLVDTVVKAALPFVMEATEHVNISSNCMRNMLTLLTGTRRLKLWALEFFDATGKPVEGMMTYNTHMLGDFDQCLNITVLKKDGRLDFRGQHCLVFLNMLTPKPRNSFNYLNKYDNLIEATRNASEVVRFIAERAHLTDIFPSKFGICVPSGCSRDDIDQVMKYVGPQLLLNTSTQYCQVEGSMPLYTTRNIVIMCIFSSLLLLGFIGTASEYYFKGTDMAESEFAKVLLCFSITTNFQKVMDTSTSEKTLTCLHGVRALTICYVIMVHSPYAELMTGIAKHLGRITTTVTLFSAQMIMNAFFLVDVFFFMAGLLHSYLRVQNELKPDPERKKVGFVIIMILRFWRIYPPYIFAILLSFLMVPRGPMAPFIAEQTTKMCEKYWWRNILFINNFYPIQEICYPHTWFLGSEMQIFLLSIFPVHLLTKSPKKGIIVNIALVLCGIISTIIMAYITKAPISISLGGFDEEKNLLLWKVYAAPFLHIAPYFTGVLVGYVLAVKKEIKIPKIYQVSGWLIAVSLFIPLLFVPRKWNLGAEYTLLESAFFWGFAKYLCASAVAWMIFCCLTGHGGVINYILSLKLWIPLSRISYISYLTSLILQCFFAANQRSSNEAHEMLFVWKHFGDLVVTALLSLVLSVLLESPCIALQKIVFRKYLESTETSIHSTDGVDNAVFKVNEEVASSKGNEQNGTTLHNITEKSFELKMNHKNIITNF